MPGRYDTTFIAGETFTRVAGPFTNVLTGLTLDLTGYSARLTARYKGGVTGPADVTAGAVAFDLSTAAGTITIGTDQTVTWMLPAAASAAVSPAALVYDLRLTAGDGTVLFPLAGEFTAREAQTRG